MSFIKKHKGFIPLFTSIFLLVIFVFTVNFDEMFSSISKANYLLITLGALIYIFSLIPRSLRWQVLLEPTKKTKLKRVYPVVVVGYMANNLLPFRLGELVRSYCLFQREKIPFSVGLVTVLLERIFDANTLILFLLVGLMFLPADNLFVGGFENHIWWWEFFKITISVGFIFSSTMIFLIVIKPNQFERFAKNIFKFSPNFIQKNVMDIIIAGIQAMQQLRSPMKLFSIIILSIMIWVLEIAVFYVVAMAFGFLEIYPEYLKMAMLMGILTSVVNIASSIPAVPGGIGMFELVSRELLLLFKGVNLSRPLASGYVSVLHATLMIPVTLMGQYFLWRDSLSLSGIIRSQNFSEYKNNNNNY